MESRKDNGAIVNSRNKSWFDSEFNEVKTMILKFICDSLSGFTVTKRAVDSTCMHVIEVNSWWIDEEDSGLIVNFANQ